MKKSEEITRLREVEKRTVAALNRRGLAREEVERAMGPLRSYLAGLEEEQPGGQEE